MSGFIEIKNNNNNRWVQHIRDFAKENNISYGCALSNPRVRQSYISNKDMSKKSQGRMEAVEREDMGKEDKKVKKVAKKPIVKKKLKIVDRV